LHQRNKNPSASVWCETRDAKDVIAADAVIKIKSAKVSLKQLRHLFNLVVVHCTGNQSTIIAMINNQLS
jgi:hypothetical protein